MPTDHPQTTTNRPANDDAPPPENAVTFTELMEATGMDEDTLLHRLAEILSKRESAL